MDFNATTLIVPTTKELLQLNLEDVYKAESRLPEIAFLNPGKANELCAFFNTAVKDIQKFISLVEYHIILAERERSLAKATVIIDKLPGLVAKLKEDGMKPNDDWREAVVMRDTEYMRCEDIVSGLNAAKSMLVSKYDSFKRAYFVSYKEKEGHTSQLNTSFNSNIDTKTKDFMGENNGVIIDADVVAMFKNN